MATRASLMIALGRAQVGKIKYFLGAKCPKGKTLADCAKEKRPLDCSGFIREAALEAGVTLPHGSQNQKAACREVPLDFALGPKGRGCLLFMSPKPGKQWPRHIAVSLSGGETLECCSGEGVCIRIAQQNKNRRWSSAGKLDALFGEV
jgi:cell wall-associated NlpC family hydrolase